MMMIIIMIILMIIIMIILMIIIIMIILMIIIIMIILIIIIIIIIMMMIIIKIGLYTVIILSQDCHYSNLRIKKKRICMKVRVHYTVRPNKKETRMSRYFSTKIELFIKYNFHCYKVQFIFFHLTPKSS